tara:strand:+ start:3893 stop:4456 length:564 start_codon:yes stop_codon:yes gene_type:complete
MKNLYLIGGGGHCNSCIDVIEQEAKYDIKGIFDLPDKIGEKVLDYKIIDSDKNIKKYINEDNFFLVTLGQIGIADKRLKYHNLNLATIISPRSYVSNHCSIGKGTIIMHDVVINANAIIGNNCIINTKALIEHDAIIGDNCHISTSAIINGNVKVGHESFIGSGAVTNNNISIPPKSFVKANSTIKK